MALGFQPTAGTGKPCRNPDSLDEDGVHEYMSIWFSFPFASNFRILLNGIKQWIFLKKWTSNLCVTEWEVPCLL
jgi:hypothetical protein